MDNMKKYYRDAQEKIRNGERNYPCNEELKIPEAASLGWLCHNFPFIEEPKDDYDKIMSCIFMYSYNAIRKLEELTIENIQLKTEINRLKEI